MRTAPVHTMSATAVLDSYFLEVRARLIEVAATLDRIDRHPNRRAVAGDPRMKFINEALAILAGENPQRAKALQELYSVK